MSVDLRPPGLADVRSAVPAAAAWAGAAVLVGVPAAAAGTAVAAALATAGLITAAWHVHRWPARMRTRGVIALGLLAAVVVTAVGVSVWANDGRRSPAALGPLVSRGSSVEAVLRLDRDLGASDRSVLATLRRAGTVDGLSVPVRWVPAVDQDGVRLPSGTLVGVRVVMQPDEPGAPTAAVAFGRGPAVVVAGPRWTLAAADTARSSFAELTARLPEPGGGLLRGLAIGDRGGLDERTESAMETVALTHLTAVSGSNCAVIVALVVLLGRALCLPRAARAGLAVAVLLGFVVLVRPDPSIVRATVMSIAVLVVHLAGRPVRGVPVLSLAVIGMLLADPWNARSFAFGLSVLATGGILVLAPPLTALLSRRVWTPLAAVVAVPVAAQTACWPLTIPLSPSLPTYAVPANLLAEPLAPVVTVVGLLACLLAPLWPDAASLCAAVAWAPAAAIGAVAHGASALPLASLPWTSGVVGVLLAALVAALLVAALLGTRRSHATRQVLLVAAVATAGVSVVAVGVPVLVVRASVPGDWNVAACDVGQGDAVLVRSEGATALVDVGDDAERLGACLDLLGIDRVDLLVLTHFDRDHVGAVDVVADRVDVALVGPVGRVVDERVVDRLVEAGVDVRTARRGVRGRLGADGWSVLWPDGAAQPGNDASLVLRFDGTCGSCASVLLLGDLDASTQRRMARAADGDELAHVDVVKVSHHGSADQDDALYRQLHADVGLIGVGADNTYGHPTPHALSMLAAAGTTVARTDRSGTIAVTRSRSGIGLWTERGTSDAARRLDDARPEGPHARQEARSRRGEDRPGPVVGHPSGARRARHRARDLPR